MTAIVQLIEILRFALDDSAQEQRRYSEILYGEKMERRPEGRLLLRHPPQNIRAGLSLSKPSA
jgi:hypothetical protein